MFKPNRNEKEEIREEKTGEESGTQKETRVSLGRLAEWKIDKRNPVSVFIENQADIWLTTKEAAEYLRISPRSLLNLTSNGKVRYYKFGSRNRFLLKDLHKTLQAKPRGGSYGN